MALPEPHILAPIPITSQQVKPGATAQRIEVEVKVAAEARTGFFPFRIATGRGISNTLLMAAPSLAFGLFPMAMLAIVTRFDA